MTGRAFVVMVLVACGGSQAGSRGDGVAARPGPADVVPDSARAVGSCDGELVVTLDDVARGQVHDQRVAIDLVPVPHTFCTLLACDRGCCNECGGGYYARLVREPAAPDLEVYLDGLPGCSGMDCNLHCEPFGHRPNTQYRFVGRVTFEAAGRTAVYHKARLGVEHYCLL